jgi:hypothetical protein
MFSRKFRYKYLKKSDIRWFILRTSIEGGKLIVYFNVISLCGPLNDLCNVKLHVIVVIVFTDDVEM